MAIYSEKCYPDRLANAQAVIAKLQHMALESEAMTEYVYHCSVHHQRLDKCGMPIICCSGSVRSNRGSEAAL
jgi:alkylation response protein AidB-like acyl-CoA dehydrogenase